ncbi:MAG TPA: CHAP domain-containing protein [Candidatus Saccharimonadales bacterium]|nr:CHAP domain-containing protein [Candidatus Saccharimonadales bacterium]
MVKTKQKMKTRKARIIQSLLVAASTAVLAFGFVISPLVRADSFDEQIKQLQADSNAKQQNVNQLQVQADSYQGEIDRLQTQINAVQSQIRENQAKRDDLQTKIQAAEDELAKQKVLLGENIKAVYVEGQISTLEMLASSKDLSQFLDKQQYRDTIQQKIRDTLDKINALKAQLKEQKTEVEKLLADQEAMNQQLGAAQAQQSALLSYTEDQKNQFTAQIRANSASIADLRAQQAAANRRLGGSAEAGDPNHGGYPNYLYAAAQDSLIDPWGMYNRECVSYTAWKVYQAYGHMPYWGGRGNANQWPGDAQDDGIPTGSTPKAGAVAISMSGYYGHAMWVEAVFSNGYIRVSQMNYDLAGHYSEMTINGSGLTYIYFN